MSAERTHGGTYSDVERLDLVIRQMPILGYGAYYVEAVQAARDALAQESCGWSPAPGLYCIQPEGHGGVGHMVTDLPHDPSSGGSE